MNYGFAREVGYLRYLLRRVLWRIAPPPSITLPTGMEFPLPRAKVFSSDVFVTQANLDWNAEYILAAFLNSLPLRGDFLDVGAHIGYYSVLLRPCVRQIYAFEPDARNHPYLAAAFARLDRAEIVPQAVADQPGELVLCDDGESSVSHIDPSATTGRFVPVTTIDQFCAAREAAPSAIKIDIEGYDILAILGAVETLRRDAPVILVEYNVEPGRPNNWETLGTFAKENGGSLFAVTRVKTGTADYQYTFREYSATELAGAELKMVFIVPRVHQAWFSTFAARQGSWNNAALRPSAIRRLLAAYPAAADQA